MHAVWQIKAMHAVLKKKPIIVKMLNAIVHAKINVRDQANSPQRIKLTSKVSYRSLRRPV